MKRFLTGGLLVVQLLVLSIAAMAQPSYPSAPSGSQPRSTPASKRPAILDEVGIEQRLNEQIPLDLKFRDEQGQERQLGEYFGKKPVVLLPVFYDCPQLCNQILSGFVMSLRAMSLEVGDDFTAIAFSFDPREGPELAAKKKDTYIRSYGKPKAADGWHFLTSDEETIKALTKAIGFRYAWDADTNQYAHASGIMVVTPEGRLSRYFYGVEYSPRFLRLGLVEASAGKIGSIVDQVLLLCYHYDPTTGQYGLIIMNVIRVSAVLLLLAMGAMFLIYRGKNKSNARVGYMHNAFVPVGLIELPLMPDQASSFAAEVDALYLVLVAMTLVISLGIAALEFWFAIKYRRRSAGEVPPEIHESKLLEITWIVIPLFITLGIFVWAASIYFKLYRPPKEALEIFVTGKQWMWRAQHPDGQREINALHVPLGRRVKLTMTSEDVLHAYFIPAFRTKADVVPGRYTHIWFEATKAGVYHLFCAEYCGSYHSGMIGNVTVLDPAAYQAWLSGGEITGSPVQAGQKLFTSLACNTCHKADGQGRGPALEGLFGHEVELATGQKVTFDETYIRESILTPLNKVVKGYEPVMPTFQGQVSEESILQLIAYIKSIGPHVRETGASGAAAPAAASPTPASAPPAAPSAPPAAPRNQPGQARTQ